ncbi:Bug family tripartite tricarboxylate transporter substrate binding protein [Microvirga massiliensis]|uniref:Bug family tripartite tricarboxylate transporter substrate binding protein n=1 Tax=Microvirga massiliensis TaxID=1033741 RepID=UPI00062B86DE|nr:tripartite tricarboxylate transporter substrate binding protein [Microvirga massiliensis]
MRKLFGALALSLATLALPAQAAEWPERNVTVVVPFGAGGTTDMFARILAQAMQAKTGTPFVVENRPGAGGNIGSGAVAKAAPDGYTLLVGTVSTHAINPFLYKNMTFDTEKAFQPVTLIARLPNLLVVNPKVPAKTIPELVDYLKKNPGSVKYGSSGAGTSTHLASELFQIKTGTKMTHVPFRSSGDVMNNLAGEHIDLAFDNMTLAWPQAQGGTVRAIAVTSTERSPTAPEIPTVSESLSGFDATSWHGLFVPAGTPRPIVDRLAAEVKQIFGAADVQAKLKEVGAVPSPMTPEAFTTFIDAERAKWKDVVEASGVSIQ